MYYVVNAAGQTEGPYPADWIRSNARPDTKVSHHQQWISYSSHPDFRQPSTPVSESRFRKILSLLNKASWSADALAARADAQLFRDSLLFLGVGVIGCNLLLLINGMFIRGLEAFTLARITSNFKLTLIWLIVCAALISPAYAMGRLLGGRARFSEVVFCFARSLGIFYIIFPLSLLFFTTWFENLWQSNIALALLFIFLFMFIIPIVCLAFSFLTIAIFVKSMAFQYRWQAWATVLSATVLTTAACLFLGDWFRWFGELGK